MRAKWIVCSTCGKPAKPRPAVREGETIVKPRDVGTTDQMRCTACGNSPDLKATMCRDCCPTGHGTRPILEKE